MPEWVQQLFPMKKYLSQNIFIKLVCVFVVGAMAAVISVSGGCAQNSVATDQEQAASGETATINSTLLRDTDFFGVNAGPYDLFTRVHPGRRIRRA